MFKSSLVWIGMGVAWAAKSGNETSKGTVDAKMVLVRTNGDMAAKVLAKKGAGFVGISDGDGWPLVGKGDKMPSSGHVYLVNEKGVKIGQDSWEMNEKGFALHGDDELWGRVDEGDWKKIAHIFEEGPVTPPVEPPAPGPERPSNESSEEPTEEQIDWAKMDSKQRAALRKELYPSPEEMARMTAEERAALRKRRIELQKTPTTVRAPIPTKNELDRKHMSLDSAYDRKIDAMKARHQATYDKTVRKAKEDARKRFDQAIAVAKQKPGWQIDAKRRATRAHLDGQKRNELNPIIDDARILRDDNIAKDKQVLNDQRGRAKDDAKKRYDDREIRDALPRGTDLFSERRRLEETAKESQAKLASKSTAVYADALKSKKVSMIVSVPKGVDPNKEASLKSLKGDSFLEKVVKGTATANKVNKMGAKKGKGGMKGWLIAVIVISALLGAACIVSGIVFLVRRNKADEDGAYRAENETTV